MASRDDDAAVLNAVPDDGATRGQLADMLGFDLDRTQSAVNRLLGHKLVEIIDDKVHVTPFARKARSVFTITP